MAIYDQNRRQIRWYAKLKSRIIFSHNKLKHINSDHFG